MINSDGTLTPRGKRASWMIGIFTFIVVAWIFYTLWHYSDPGPATSPFKLTIETPKLHFTSDGVYSLTEKPYQIWFLGKGAEKWVQLPVPP